MTPFSARDVSPGHRIIAADHPGPTGGGNPTCAGRIALLSTFISVVVLQLVAEHRLSLDDTVGRWLPGVVHGNGNDGGKITVRELLQHTSGLHNYTDDLQAQITSPQAYRELDG